MDFILVPLIYYENISFNLNIFLIKYFIVPASDACTKIHSKSMELHLHIVVSGDPTCINHTHSSNYIMARPLSAQYVQVWALLLQAYALRA